MAGCAPKSLCQSVCAVAGIGWFAQGPTLPARADRGEPDRPRRARLRPAHTQRARGLRWRLEGLGKVVAEATNAYGLESVSDPIWLTYKPHR